MAYKSNTQFLFEGFTLDLGAGRLSANGEDVALRPKSFALLSYMVRNAGRVVTKDELMTFLWPKVTVTEDSLTQCVRDVRKALLDSAATLLRTVPRRGYLFKSRPQTGPVDVRGGKAAAMSNGAEDVALAGQQPDAPPLALRNDGIAILPFTLLSSSQPGDGLLIDGLVNDTIGRLARLRNFHVIARGSTFAIRHLAQDPVAAGRALGVAYVVVGSALMQETKVKLRVEMVGVEGGGILWTEDLVETRDVFLDLLDRLTEQIVQSVQMQLTSAEARRALSLPEPGLDAWGAYHCGLPDAFRFNLAATTRALPRFERATRLAPGFARAHAAMSFCHYFFAFSGVSGDRAAESATAMHCAENAMQADDSCPASQWAYGRALWLQGDNEGCLLHARQAVALCPSFAHAHYTVGFVETHCGDAQTGLAQMDRALALSPYDPFLGSIQITRALALFRLGRIDEAADWAKQAARQPNSYVTMLATAVMILTAAGRTDQAHLVARKLRETSPNYSVEMLMRSFGPMHQEISDLYQRGAASLGL